MDQLTIRSKTQNEAARDRLMNRVDPNSHVIETVKSNPKRTLKPRQQPRTKDHVPKNPNLSAATTKKPRKKRAPKKPPKTSEVPEAQAYLTPQTLLQTPSQRTPHDSERRRDEERMLYRYMEKRNRAFPTRPARSGSTHTFARDNHIPDVRFSLDAMTHGALQF